MKILLTLIALCMFNISCGVFAEKEPPPTQWELATTTLLENWKSNPNSLTQLLDNCFAYGRIYQKQLCLSLKRQATTPLSLLQPQLPVDYSDNIRKVAFDFPKMANHLDQIEATMNKCFINGDVVETLACGQISRTVERFSNGDISETEFIRELSPLVALVKEYRNSQPSIGQILLGAGRILAEGAAQDNSAATQQFQLQQLQQQQIIQQGEIERQRRLQFLRDHPIR